MNKEKGVSSFGDLTKGTRGQVTIFIILSLIIVAAAAVVYFFYPQIKSTLVLPANPQDYIQNCMQNEIKGTIANLSLQGGSIQPSPFYSYYSPALKQSYDIAYLCYTNKYYSPCIMQQPLLQSYMESQIVTNIQPAADTCFQNMEQSYKSRGYTVNVIPGNITAQILPNKVLVIFNDKVTLERSGTPQRYDIFPVAVSSQVYQLVSIAESILNWEALYGDAPARSYMANYHDLLIEKNSQSDGTKVYVLTNLNTGEVFQFAVRSFVWPLGYGY